MHDLNISIDIAELIALFMESVFYGLYLVSFGMCMYTLLAKGRPRNRQRVIFFLVALGFGVFATIDVAFLLRHILDAFVWYHGPGGAVGELEDISYWVNAMKTIAYVAQTSLGDGVLIYRCYVVYEHNWKVIVPLCALWIGGLVTEFFNAYTELTLHRDTFLTARQLAPFITSMIGVTLALNLIATSMIVYKIWLIERRCSELIRRRTSKLRRCIRIIVESGLMYTTGVICFFVVYMASNNALYGVSDCVVQIIGISFNLIIIRIDQGKTVETEFSLAVLSQAQPNEVRTEPRRPSQAVHKVSAKHQESVLPTHDVSALLPGMATVTITEV